MSEIEIMSMRPFSTVDAQGERVSRTLITYRGTNGTINSKTVPGTIRETEAAIRLIRGE